MKNFYEILKYVKIKVEEEKKIKGNDENLQMIEQYLEEVERDKVPLAEEINEKTKHYKPLENINIYEAERPNIPQGDMLVQDLANNKDVLEERRKQLETIHQTSAKIKDMSDAMAKQLDQQGAILDDVEANVITAEDNAKKAKQEITKADEISKSNRKKYICLIVIILVAILGISAILLSLLL